MGVADQVSKHPAPKSVIEVQLNQHFWKFVEESKLIVGKLVRLLQLYQAPPLLLPPKFMALDRFSAGKDVKEVQPAQGPRTAALGDEVVITLLVSMKGNKVKLLHPYHAPVMSVALLKLRAGNDVRLEQFCQVV